MKVQLWGGIKCGGIGSFGEHHWEHHWEQTLLGAMYKILLEISKESNFPSFKYLNYGPHVKIPCTSTRCNQLPSCATTINGTLHNATTTTIQQLSFQKQGFRIFNHQRNR